MFLYLIPYFTCRAEIDAFTWNNNPNLLLLTPERYGEWYPARENWPVGKEESIFVLATHNTSTFPSIISLKFSNLFLIQLIFKYEKFIIEAFLFFNSRKKHSMLLR